MGWRTVERQQVMIGGPSVMLALGHLARVRKGGSSPAALSNDDIP